MTTQNAFTIYTKEFKGSTVWMIPAEHHPFERGMGDTIHRSLEEAEQERAFLLKKMDSREKMHQKSQVLENKARADKEAAEDMQGFAENESPLRRGKILTTLLKSMYYKSENTNRKAVIESKINAGWQVSDNNPSGENRLVSPCGMFFLEGSDITKTGMAYAAHLQSK